MRRLARALPGSRAAWATLRRHLPEAWLRRDRFERHYVTNYWNSDESQSGRGSSLSQTAAIRDELPRLCQRLGVASLLDVPCGDVHWISQIDLPGVCYRGLDIVPALIAGNRARFAGSGRDFQVLDVVARVPPQADLILCRDLLVHLPLRDALMALRNFRRSGSTWLLTTTFIAREINTELAGDWRPLNLLLPPFSLPPPAALITEFCTEEDGCYSDKSLGLWRLADLP